MTSINDCRVIELPRITDQRGSLTVIEGGQHIPFEIKRVFYLYDVSASAVRGAHAHKTLHQLLVCVTGSLDVRANEKAYHLSVPWEGLYIPPMTWVDVFNFAPGSICLVLCSEKYDESDYYRVYKEFLDEC